jgi:hypothetical protein
VIYQPPDIPPAAAVIVVRDDRGRDRLVGVTGVDLPGALVAVKSAAGVSAEQG